jgi:hypothetical protein
MYLQVFATQMYISLHNPSIYKFSQHKSIYACMTQVYIHLHNTNIYEFTLRKYLFYMIHVNKIQVHIKQS